MDSDFKMPTWEDMAALPQLCAEVHVCFPPRPSYCSFCHVTDPDQCRHPDIQAKITQRRVEEARARQGGSQGA